MAQKAYYPLYSTTLSTLKKANDFIFLNHLLDLFFCRYYCNSRRLYKPSQTILQRYFVIIKTRYAIMIPTAIPIAK